MLDTRKLIACLKLLASDKSGEVLSAAAAINRLLASANTTWEEVFLPRSSPVRQRSTLTDEALLEMARGKRHWLNSWELAFLESMTRVLDRGHVLTERQREKLIEIASK